MWALFIGHLSTEKLLKAYYVKIKDIEVPRTHDLYKLAMLSGLIYPMNRKTFCNTLRFLI